MRSLKAWGLGVLCWLPLAAPAGTLFVYGYAGDGINGSSGDGGPATAARLYLPYGLVLGPTGDLYIADKLNSRVRKVDKATGIISTVAGNGTYGLGGDGGLAVDAELGAPHDMAFDAQGDLYILDALQGMVRKVDAGTGIISRVAGTGLLGYSGDGGPALNARFNDPQGMVIDAAGNIFVAEFQTSVVRKIDAATGIISTYAGIGLHGYSGDGGPANAARLDFPTHLSLGPQGDLYITDRANNVIRKVDAATGIISTVAGNGAFAFGGDGGPALSASFAQPFAAEFDAAGNMYIADAFNHRVRKLDAATGLVSTLAGTGALGYSGDGGPALAAEFKNIYELAVSPAGEVFVSDTLNYAVRVLREPTPIPTPTLTALPTEEPPLTLVLYPANPDPGRSEVWLPYGLGTAADVEIQIYTVAGELVRRLHPGIKPKGVSEERWDLRNEAGTGVASGVFAYRVRARSRKGEELSAVAKCAVLR